MGYISCTKREVFTRRNATQKSSVNMGMRLRKEQSEARSGKRMEIKGIKRK